MKNPWMSLWLSAANKAAGPMRGAVAAEMKRQQTAMTKQMFRAATGTRAKPASRKKR